LSSSAEEQRLVHNVWRPENRGMCVVCGGKDSLPNVHTRGFLKGLKKEHKDKIFFIFGKEGIVQTFLTANAGNYVIKI
jgi:hypothetical protein